LAGVALCYARRTAEFAGAGDLCANQDWTVWSGVRLLQAADDVDRYGQPAEPRGGGCVADLDWLPQLVNVLRGDMSLVGPRPCLPTQAELIAARHRQGAFDLRPGITGLAQVQGVDMSEPERLARLDGDYARTRSFAGDLMLILSTITGSGIGRDSSGKI
jgi:Bacterial sugar transferase